MKSRNASASGDLAAAAPPEEMQLVNDVKAAEILGIPLGTLRYWRVVKKGPRFIRLESHIRYDVADLRAYVAAGRSAGTSVRAEAGG